MYSSFNIVQQADTTAFPGFTAAQQAQLLTATQSSGSALTNFAMDCYGFLEVPEDGLYTFSLSSDDGSELAIDNNVIINMPQDQDMGSATSSPVSLFAGQHTVNVEYFQGLPTQEGLILQWQGPSNAGLSTMQPVKAFLHEVQP